MKYTIISALLFCFTANASKIIRNGGDAIVCNKTKNPTAVVLDHYEASNLFGLTIDLGDKDLSVEEKVEIAFNRLEKLSPLRHKVYKEFAQSFVKEAQFIKDAQFKDVEDSEHIIIPNGCKIEQAAIQIAPKFPGAKRYFINDDIWQLMDNDSKAGLIIHEIIYREALEHKDSRAVRYVGAVISSVIAETYNENTFRDMLRAYEFKLMDIGGIGFKEYSLSYLGGEVAAIGYKLDLSAELAKYYPSTVKIGSVTWNKIDYVKVYLSTNEVDLYGQGFTDKFKNALSIQTASSSSLASDSFYTSLSGLVLSPFEIQFNNHTYKAILDTEIRIKYSFMNEIESLHGFMQ